MSSSCLKASKLTRQRSCIVLPSTLRIVVRLRRCGPRWLKEGIPDILKTGAVDWWSLVRERWGAGCGRRKRGGPRNLSSINSLHAPLPLESSCRVQNTFTEKPQTPLLPPSPGRPSSWG